MGFGVKAIRILARTKTCLSNYNIFIQSAGKEGVNAILPVGLVMVRCIREFYKRTGKWNFFSSDK